jgi:hypothetical protein
MERLGKLRHGPDPKAERRGVSEITSLVFDWTIDLCLFCPYWKPASILTDLAIRNPIRGVAHLVLVRLE